MAEVQQEPARLQESVPLPVVPQTGLSQGGVDKEVGVAKVLQACRLACQVLRACWLTVAVADIMCLLLAPGAHQAAQGGGTETSAG